MKYILLFLLTFNICLSQTETINTPGTVNSASIQLGGIGAKRVLFSPVVGKELPLSAGGIEGRIATNKFTHKLMWHNGTLWLTVIDSTTLKNNYYTKIESDSFYETKFSKNTAFNKDFGISSNTIAQGNDSRILNGQTAFGWGNHASEGYLKNFTESDPSVPPYSKTLTSFSVIKSSTDGLYQPIGTYLTKSVADGYYYPLGSNPLGYLTAIPSKSFNNTAVKTINGVGVQLSTTRDTHVTYTVTHTIALTLLLSSGSSQVYLEISPNNTTWITISQAGYSDAVAVAVALTKTTTNNVQGLVPSGYYVRLRSVVSGGGSSSYTNGQEVLN